MNKNIQQQTEDIALRLSPKFIFVDLNPQNWKYFLEEKNYYPSSKSHVVDESEDVWWAEIAEWEERHDEDPRGGRHPGHLDHGEDLRHLALHRPRVEQPRRGQEDPIDSCSVFIILRGGGDLNTNLRKWTSQQRQEWEMQTARTVAQQMSRHQQSYILLRFIIIHEFDNTTATASEPRTSGTLSVV